MDDKEYYSLMNRSSSWLLQQELKKKNISKTESSSTNITKVIDINHTELNEIKPLPSTYANLELRQGQADAEMLLEKKQIN